jgi:protein-S-isoprenylcysteine O-methyltransferase Ste14
MTLAGVGFFAWLALIGLDAARFRWSRVPDWAQAFGAALLVGAMALFVLTFRANPFLSPAVRVQSDRGQSVVSAGPYRLVRHPMYAAFLVVPLEWLGTESNRRHTDFLSPQTHDTRQPEILRRAERHWAVHDVTPRAIESHDWSHDLSHDAVRHRVSSALGWSPHTALGQ